MEEMVDTQPVGCGKCGVNFICGVANGGETCWCAEVAPRYAVQKGQCLCPECLMKSVSLP